MRSWFLSAFVVIGLLASASARADEPKERGFKAGAASRVVTPSEPLWMAGYASRKKPAEGKQHDLMSRRPQFGRVKYPRRGLI